MKKTFIFSACIFAALVLLSFVPKDCTQKNWGTKTLYTPQSTTAVQTPEGYQPAFINYVGRHGARHLTGLEDAYMLLRLLKRAENADGLTEQGLVLQKRVSNLIAVETGYTPGDLTSIGEQELWSIGYRMKAHYASLISGKDAHIKVVTTRQKRTKQSAASFIKGAGRAMDGDAGVQVNENDSVSLRFFEIAPAYRTFVQGKGWSPALQKIIAGDRGKRMAAQLTDKFFKKDFAGKIMNNELPDTNTKGKIYVLGHAEFTDALFSVASINNAIYNEIINNKLSATDVDIASLLTCEEVNWLEFVNSAKDFLLKGPGQDINGIQVINAAPLLVDFINTTDSAIQYHNNTAVLRFAHAETMSPFASLLQVEGADKSVADIVNYDKEWQAGNIIPFSANLQWIVYKPSSGEGDYLVTILYNEKPVRIPVSTNRFPFYKWNDVRDFYIQKLKTLHADINENMYAYLLSL